MITTKTARHDFMFYVGDKAFRKTQGERSRLRLKLQKNKSRQRIQLYFFLENTQLHAKKAHGLQGTPVNGFVGPIHVQSARGTDVVTWVQVGDLHMTIERPHLSHYESIVIDLNARFVRSMNFVLFPGDNAQNRLEQEYFLIKRLAAEISIPVYAIAGDHDVHSGSLDIGNVQFNFLNGNAYPKRHPKAFDLGEAQIAWLRKRLADSKSNWRPFRTLFTLFSK
jgi:Calcineurin-like phosphoesterase